jgi:hypothetical protein
MIEYQKQVIEKCLKQPFLQHVMPDFVVSKNNLCQCETICENLKLVWGKLKYGKGKDHYYVRHIVATVVVSTQSSLNIRAVKSCVGLNYKSI